MPDHERLTHRRGALCTLQRLYNTITGRSVDLFVALDPANARTLGPVGQQFQPCCQPDQPAVRRVSSRQPFQNQAPTACLRHAYSRPPDAATGQHAFTFHTNSSKSPRKHSANLS